MLENKNVQLSIKVSKSTHSKLIEIAKESGEDNLSAVIRQAIMHYLKYYFK